MQDIHNMGNCIEENSLYRLINCSVNLILL